MRRATKILLWGMCLALTLPLLMAQAPAKPAAEPEKKAAEEKPAADTAPSPAAEGPSAPEALVKGSMEVGYRIVGPIGGSNNAYRSVVNLGEGLRLINTDLTMSPSLKWIDDMALRMYNWGGDPYNSTYFRAGKQKLYRFTVDYRNIAYFNSLPSFANPNIERGLLVSQRSFDMSRRYANANLELLPWGNIIPYFSFENSSGDGRGVTMYVPALNEYPVPNDLRDSTRTFREGVRFQYNRFHVTAEAGQLRFRDDQRVYENAPAGNFGDRLAPLNGQSLVLRTLQQAYGIRGEGTFYRGAVTANPFSWLDVFGNYLYMLPKVDTNYFESATGLFATNSVFPSFSAQQQLFSAMAKQPHTQAHAGMEVRPFSRLRIIESIYTDRMHTSSSGQGTINAGGVTQLASADRLVVNFNQHQVEALVDITNKLTVRGGHRYTWGDSQLRAPSLASFTGLESGELKRQTGLGGFTYRPFQGLSATADVEVARSDRVYYRTSLQDYERYRLRLRWQIVQNLSVSLNGSYLGNNTANSQTLPKTLGDYDFRSIDRSISFAWSPKGGDRFRLMGEYARQNLRTDIRYFGLPFGNPELSRYREDVHAGSFLGDFVPARGKEHAPRFTLGGSFYRSAGSRPTLYLQPLVRTAFPLSKRVEFVAEWRYWGMSQPLYRFEQFRNNQATISLRIFQ